MKKYLKKTKKNILEITINSSIIPDETTINFLNKKKLISLREFLKKIEIAKENYLRWEFILIKIESLFSVSWPLLDEIRRNLLTLKGGKTPVLCFFKKASLKEYYIASIGNSIFMSPTGEIQFFDFELDIFFYKQVLDKLGIEAQFIKTGPYKTFADKWTQNHISNPYKKMLIQILKDLKKNFSEKVMESRQQIENIEKIHEIGIFTPPQAKKSHLIDEIIYEKNILKKILPKEKTANYWPIQNLDKPILNRIYNFFKKKEKLAIVYASGIIQENSSPSTLDKNPKIEEAQFIDILEKIKQNKNIKGVLIRVESPGGSALTSDILWNSIQKLKKEKPIVISMGQYAASGGYYISMPANYIFAEATTLTGSIGVIFGKFYLQNLFDKIGIHRDHIALSGNINLYNPWNKYTEKELEKIKKLIYNYYYKNFLSKAALGRGKTLLDIHKVAKGRVWTGYSAKKIELVDEIGGLQESLQKLRQIANISPNKDVKYYIYPKRKLNLFANLFSMGSLMKGTIINTFLKDNLLEEILNQESEDFIKYVMPNIIINH